MDLLQLAHCALAWEAICAAGYGCLLPFSEHSQVWPALWRAGSIVPTSGVMTGKQRAGRHTIWFQHTVHLYANEKWCAHGGQRNWIWLPTPCPESLLAWKWWSPNMTGLQVLYFWFQTLNEKFKQIPVEESHGWWHHNTLKYFFFLSFFFYHLGASIFYHIIYHKNIFLLHIWILTKNA